MNFYADYVRNKLNAAISSMSSQIEDYVKNPGHDFTRNRKMNFTSTINFLLTMEGGSLNSELHKYFNYDLNQITRSGFIKQRNKLKPDTMEHLFQKFHEQILCNKKYHVISFVSTICHNDSLLICSQFFNHFNHGRGFIFFIRLLNQSIDIPPALEVIQGIKMKLIKTKSSFFTSKIRVWI